MDVLISATLVWSLWSESRTEGRAGMVCQAKNPFIVKDVSMLSLVFRLEMKYKPILTT